MIKKLMMCLAATIALTACSDQPKKVCVETATVVEIAVINMREHRMVVKLDSGKFKEIRHDAVVVGDSVCTRFEIQPVTPKGN